MGKCVLAVVMFILLINLVNATTITENEITITSDKDTYFCEPIFINDACLIKAKITITNERVSSVNLDGLSTFTSSIDKITYLDSSGSRIPQQAEAFIPSQLFLGGQSKTYELQFFASESGKFDYTVNIFQLGTGNLLATTVLDPYYNVSVNATTPSYLLHHGVNMNESINDYENKTDITTGLSDGLDSTSYLTYFASMPSVAPYIINGWAFNEYIFGNKLYSFSGLHHTDITGTLNTVSIGDYYGAYFDGVNDYARFSLLLGTEMDIPDLNNFTMCLAFNTTMSGVGDRGLITKGSSGDGFYMRYKVDETIDCEFDGDTGSAVASSGSVDDGLNHVICCRKHEDTVDLWLDGSYVDSATANIGQIINSNDVFFGSEDLGLNRCEVTMRQIGLFNTSLDNTTLSDMGSSRAIADFNKGQAINVFFNYSLTKDINHSNYLAIVSDVNDLTTIRILSSDNMTHPDSTSYVTERITTGTSYIPIDDIIYDGYNLPFRYFGLQGRFDTLASEIYLVVSINDIENPSITNCQANTTNLSCGETVRIQCNVTDNGEVYQVWFKTNNTATSTVATERANNDNGIFYIDKKLTGNASEQDELVWVFANATDLGGNYNLSNLNIHINYTCGVACVESWVQDSIVCLINDSYLVSYTDQNSCNSTLNLPLVNGTYASCNYCSEDLVKDYTTECHHNGTYYVIDFDWVDNNYFSCCVFTNLVSDCSVDYSPYNVSGIEFCTFLATDFQINYDEVAFFGLKSKDKVYWRISLNATNTTYKCQSYVMTTSQNLIQTNPLYSVKSDALIDLSGTSYEDRDYFMIQNGIGNVYFTKENLIFDGRLYLFGVECSDGTEILRSEKLIVVGYENLNNPIPFYAWLVKNASGIVVIFFISIIILLFFALLIYFFRRHYK